MIDFGLLALFAVQCGLVGLVYHAWNGVKAEISVLQREKERIDALAAKYDAVMARLEAAEKAPMERIKRIDAVEASIGETDRRMGQLSKEVERVDGKVMSLNGRIAAKAKAAKGRKADEDDEEEDPAAQAEEQMSLGDGSPGFLPRVEAPSNPAIPPGFGVVRRKAV